MNKTLTPRVSNRRCSRQLLDEIFVQPWFVDRRTAAAIRHLIPDHVFRKMRLYFDDWGCLVCRSRRRNYGTNGMCHLCVTRIQKRLVGCLQKRGLPTGTPNEEVMTGDDRVRSAKVLLSDLALGGWSPNRMKLRKIKWSD
jgi:hypothetical protein